MCACLSGGFLLGEGSIVKDGPFTPIRCRACSLGALTFWKFRGVFGNRDEW